MVATRCHISKLKCTKFDFGWGSAPDPLAGFNWSYFYREGGMEWNGEGRGRKGVREVEGRPLA